MGPGNMRRAMYTAVLLSVVIVVRHRTHMPFALDSFSVGSLSGLPGESNLRRALSSIRPSDRPIGRRRTRMGAFDDIFVVSLKKRTDRRERMERIRAALDLEWEYVFASESGDAATSRITEHVRAVRDNATAADFKWPSNLLSHVEDPSVFPMTDAETRSLHPSNPRAPHPLPEPPVPDTRPQLSIYGAEFRAPEPGKEFHQSPPRVATYHSHMDLLRRAADAPYANYTALILEDDVDMDFGISKHVGRVFGTGAIPSNWDMLYLGHCPASPSLDSRATEAHHPPLFGAPEIRKSWGPYCTHAYAVSRNGARRLLTQLRCSDVLASSIYVHMASTQIPALRVRSPHRCRLHDSHHFAPSRGVLLRASGGRPGARWLVRYLGRDSVRFVQGRLVGQHP